MSDYFTATYGSHLDGRMERKDELIGHVLRKKPMRLTFTLQDVVTYYF